jgi:hypothetical protein
VADTVKNLGTRVKHMSIINHALGFIYKLEATEPGIDDQEQLDRLDKSRVFFDKALESNPNSVVTLR